MKILLKSVLAASTLALAACGGGADDQAAENIEAAADMKAENLEARAENATTEAREDALENQAEVVEEAGEEKADAIDDNDGATGVESNVSGM